MTFRSAFVVPLLVLSACSSAPVQSLETLSDVNLGDDSSARAVTASESDADGLPAQAEIAAEVAPSKPGFLGGLFGGRAAATVGSVSEEGAETPPDTPRRAGLLGGLFGGGGTDVPQTPSEPQVTSDMLLPFGQIAPNCTVTKAEMGRLVDENAGYAIYDTAPNGAALRTHYVTGFKDNCARQFSAATALMGDIGTHEVVRYLPSNAKHPYSAADSAYEVIKASYCGAVRGQPCGSKLDRLASNTTFITTYESFADNAEWADILLSNGTVAAIGPVAR